jgi:[citrate (pro-3S)-lyase] ligase
VLDTSCYAVSSITFPTYFLKDGDPGGAAQMELDLQLFATRIAPHFHIKTRFVGSEPLSVTTARYNETMHRVLPPYGVAVTELERVQADAAPISASRVRKALAAGAIEELDALVPKTTLNILLSPKVRRIWDTREEAA